MLVLASKLARKHEHGCARRDGTSIPVAPTCAEQADLSSHQQLDAVAWDSSAAFCGSRPVLVAAMKRGSVTGPLGVAIVPARKTEGSRAKESHCESLRKATAPTEASESTVETFKEDDARLDQAVSAEKSLKEEVEKLRARVRDLTKSGAQGSAKAQQQAKHAINTLQEQLKTQEAAAQETKERLRREREERELEIQITLDERVEAVKADGQKAIDELKRRLEQIRKDEGERYGQLEEENLSLTKKFEFEKAKMLSELTMLRNSSAVERNESSGSAASAAASAAADAGGAGEGAVETARDVQARLDTPVERSELDAQTAKVSTLTAELAATRESLSEATASMEASESMVKTLQEDKASLQQTVTRLEQDVSNSAQAASPRQAGELDRLRRRIADAETDVGLQTRLQKELRADVERESEKARKFQAQLQEQNRGKLSLQRQIKELEEKVGDLETELVDAETAANGRMERFREEAFAGREKGRGHEKELSDKLREAEKKTLDVESSKKRELAKIREEIDDVKFDQRTLQAEKEQLQREKADLEKQLRQRDESAEKTIAAGDKSEIEALRKLAKELADVQKKLGKVEKEKQKEINKVTRAFGKRLKQVEAAHLDQLDENLAEAHFAKMQAAEKDSQITSLEEDLATAETRREAVHAELLDVKKSLTAKDEELASVKPRTKFWFAKKRAAGAEAGLNKTELAHDEELAQAVLRAHPDERGEARAIPLWRRLRSRFGRKLT